MLAEEVFPLILIEDRHGAQVLNGLEDLLVIDCDGVCLVDGQVVGLPALPQGIVRLIEQGKDVLLVQHLIQYLFRNVDLVDHYVVVVGVLSGDDDTQLIDQRDLGGSHCLHGIAVQGAGLVGQEDIRQAAVHAVIGVCQGRIFYLVDETGDHIPVDLEILGQCGRDFDNFPDCQAKLGAELVVRSHGEEPGEARLCQHPQDEDDGAVEGLEVLSGDLQERCLVKAPVITPAAGAEYGHDEEPGIVLQTVIHGALQIRVDHQLQELADLPVRLLADIGFLVLPVRDLQPLLGLQLDVFADLAVSFLHAPLGVQIGAAAINHRPSGHP